MFSYAINCVFTLVVSFQPNYIFPFLASRENYCITHFTPFICCDAFSHLLSFSYHTVIAVCNHRTYLILREFR